MLQKSHISNVEMHSEKWLQARLGKFTASNNWKLMGVRGMGETGMTYIRGRVYEELSGQSAERDVSTFDIEWGHKYEPEALQRFGEKMGLEFLISQKLICEPGSRFGCTPDALWIRGESPDQTAYNVSTVEVKCFQGVHHIEMCECQTAEDLKVRNPKVYWQVVDQMLICDSLTGWAVFYNPTMRIADLHTIEFRKVKMLPDFKELASRKHKALLTFEDMRNKLLNL